MKAINLIVVIVLALAIGSQFYSAGEAKPRDTSTVFDPIPTAIKGWDVEDHGLGPTETTDENARDILRLEHFINRSFEKGPYSFMVYVAFWEEKSMPVQLVASHTPDRCWVANGWEVKKQQHNIPVNVDAVSLKPAQFRIFEGLGELRHVLFWHLVGQDIHDYGNRNTQIPNPIQWIRGALESYIKGSKEQFFIRVDASHSFEEMMQFDAFKQVMHGLSELGLSTNADNV